MSKKAHFKEVLSTLVLEVFQKSGQQLLNPKQVSAKLKLNDADARDTISEILRDEVRKGTLREPERGRFQLKELKTFVTGKVDLTTDGSAFIITEDELEADIYVAPVNCAMHSMAIKCEYTCTLNKKVAVKKKAK